MNVPPQWDRIDLEALEGVVLVIGGMDLGKSFFSRYLYEKLRRNSNTVSFLDGDPGQGALGPPGTMTLAMSGEGEWGFPPEGRKWQVFVGSFSPVGHMLPVLVGAARLLSASRRAGGGTAIYDTTGLIDPGRGGGHLKLAKINLLQPSTVFAFQRSKELNYLLEPLRRSRRVTLVELRPSPAVKSRAPETRRSHRRDRFSRYFQEAQEMKIHWPDLAVFPRPAFTPHRLVAFESKEGFVRGLGIVIHVEEKAQDVVIRTPLLSFNEVDAVSVGDLEVDPNSFSDSKTSERA
jgi:polynucleotide 5'-hydroxyl-kinase GRC3/NOL9